MLERAERDVLLAREAVEERLSGTEQVLVGNEIADTRHHEAATPEQAHQPASREVDSMAWHVEMEPSRPADPRLKAVEVRHRDHDPAVPAEHLDRSAQTQRRVVKMLEHVPEDGNVGDPGGRAVCLDRRVPNRQWCVGLRCVRLDA